MAIQRLEVYRAIGQLTKEAVTFATQHEVTGVWVVLDGAASISVGWRAAKELSVPLLPLVWDHVDHVLKQQRLSRLLVRCIQRDFTRSLEAAIRVAVVSERMAEDYRLQFGARTHLLRHGVSLPADFEPCQGAPTREAGDACEPWIIGFGGTDYGHSAWECLIQALDLLHWQVGERPVTLRVLGTAFRVRTKNPCRIEFLGYQATPEDALAILARSDINYLPHPFEEDWQAFSRYSFPTKLSAYVSCGVPVLVHAPAYSSLDAFCRRYRMGVHCDALCSETLARELKDFAISSTRQAAARKAVATVAREELSAEQFHDAFRAFIGFEGRACSSTMPVELKA